MAYTLSSLIQDAASKMGKRTFDSFVATGGGTTTCICTNLTDKFEDDTPLNATLIVARDSAGASAAPEGEFGVVSAYVQSSNTFTIPTLTAAIASGDSIMLVKSSYPLEVWRQQANTLLRSFGSLDFASTSVITLSENVSEYDLAVAYKYDDIIKIEQATDTDTSDYQWETVPRDSYEVVPNSAGSAAKLIFRDPLDASYALKVWYRGFHSKVYAYSDVIDERFAPEMISTKLALNMLMWSGVTDDNTEMIRFLSAEVAKNEQKFRVFKVKRSNKTLTYGDISHDYPGDPSVYER